MFPQCFPVSHAGNTASSICSCFQDTNYAHATRQGILTEVRASEQLQKFCEHEQPSTYLIFASNSSKIQILRALSNTPVHALRGKFMGSQGKIAKKQSSKMCVYYLLFISSIFYYLLFISSNFHSEIHFREETNTVSRKTPFLYLLAFLSRLSWALAFLSE